MAPRVIKQILLPGDGGAVMLLDWMAVADGCNLIRVDKAGETVWKAVPPNGPADCFTEFRMDGDALKACAFSGYLTAVDIDNGAVTVLAFTK